MQWCCRSKCLVLFLGLKFWAIVLAPARPNQGYQIEENLVRWAASDANRFLSRSCATHTRHIHWGSHGWMWFALPRNLCSKQHGDISYSRSLRVYIASKSSVKKKSFNPKFFIANSSKKNNPGPWYLRMTWEPENPCEGFEGCHVSVSPGWYLDKISKLWKRTSNLSPAPRSQIPQFSHKFSYRILHVFNFFVVFVSDRGVFPVKSNPGTIGTGIGLLYFISPACKKSLRWPLVIHVSAALFFP